MNKPELTLLKRGAAFKLLQVTGEENAEMPKHISTEEAIVIIEEGSAIIYIDEREYLLKKGDSFIIPGGWPHSLLIKTMLRALVIMPIESSIEFIG